MITHHHPDDATLMSYAAGSLPGNAALLITCHLQFCGRCQAKVRDAETIGGTLLDGLGDTELSPGSRNRVLRMLAEPQTAAHSAPRVESHFSPDEIPLPLQPVLGRSYDELNWSPLVPGVGQIRFDAAGGKMRLLNIAPGTCLPMHSHRDSELTMVLRGSYSDEIGHFGVGDVADLDPSVEHQPIVDSQVSCISLVVSDAPLKFRGIVPRMLQPFFGI